MSANTRTPKTTKSNFASLFDGGMPKWEIRCFVQYHDEPYGVWHESIYSLGDYRTMQRDMASIKASRREDVKTDWKYIGGCWCYSNKYASRVFQIAPFTGTIGR